MKTAKLQAFLTDLQKEAGQEAINAFGRELLQLLARHGFQPDDPAEEAAPREKKPPGAKAPARPSKPVNAHNEPRDGTDLARVLRAIRTNPGLKGIELKRAIEKSGTAIVEKTFRTSLRRLKMRSLIREADKRWHPAKQDSTA